MMGALSWLCLLAAVALCVWAVVWGARRGLFGDGGTTRDHWLAGAMSVGGLLLLLASFEIDGVADRERIRALEAKIGSLKVDPVPPGDASLYVIFPPKEDSYRHGYVTVMLYPLERYRLDKREERRGDETVTVWSGMAGDYAVDLADRVRSLKVEAWVDGAGSAEKKP